MITKSSSRKQTGPYDNFDKLFCLIVMVARQSLILVNLKLDMYALCTVTEQM